MAGAGLSICIIMEYHPDDLTGGAEVQVFTLARRFSREGHRVTYMCQHYDASKPRDSMVEGVRVLRTLRWHRVFRWVVGLALVRTVLGLHPDVIYQRGASPYTGLAALSARLARVPFVWGCAEDVSLSGGVFLRASRLGSRRGALGMLKSSLLRCNARVTQSLFDGGLRRARAIIVQSSLQAGLLMQTYRLHATIIPNGVELTDETGDRSPTPLVLWLNNLMRRKKPEVFIELARTLADLHRDTDFVLVGGRADDEYMGEIRHLAEDVPRLMMQGKVPFEETRSWFQRAWIYVLTSESEGFPNVMLQAWAARTPVVSLTVDPDHLLCQQGLGRLSGSAEALARDVSGLLSDEVLRDQIGRSSRQYVADHLEIGLIAQRYLELFRKVTEK